MHFKKYIFIKTELKYNQKIQFMQPYLKLKISGSRYFFPISEKSDLKMC